MKLYNHKARKIALWSIFLLSLAYIAYELQSFSHVWKEIKIIPVQQLLTAISFLFILMLFNWLLEAKKWQYLAKKVLPDYSLKISVQTILCGITLGLFTPNRAGEYGARVFYVESTYKGDLFILSFIDRLTQLWITVFFGVIFTFMYVTDFFPEGQYIMVLISTCILILHTSIAIFRNRIIDFIVSRKLLKKYFHASVYISAKDLGYILTYAGLRYLIFVVQYLVWGYYTDSYYEIDKGLIAVNTMLFAKSIVPSAGLSELGIREGLLIYLYKSYGLSGVTAFHSALVVYGINLVIPAVAGLFFMPRMSLWRSRLDR